MVFGFASMRAFRDPGWPQPRRRSCRHFVASSLGLLTIAIFNSAPGNNGANSAEILAAPANVPGPLATLVHGRSRVRANAGASTPARAVGVSTEAALDVPRTLGRRDAVKAWSARCIFAAPWFVATAGGAGPATAADQSWVAEVGAGAPFGTINAALAAVPADASAVSVVLKAGVYKERLTVGPGPPVTLISEAPGEASVVWETTQPYEAALTLNGGAVVTARGVRFRHASKSVANNFGIYSANSKLVLEDCDVSSSTGAGVAAEGGELTIAGGTVHDCARQGLAAFGPLLGEKPLLVKVKGTVFRKNGNDPGDGDAIRGPFDGVLARDNVDAELTDVVVEGSGAAGVAAVDDARVVISGQGPKENRGGRTRTESGGEIEIQAR